jgi:hypothetical protein
MLQGDWKFPRINKLADVSVDHVLRWLDLRRALYMALPLDFVIYLPLLLFRHPDIDRLRHAESVDPIT